MRVISCAFIFFCPFLSSPFILLSFPVNFNLEIGCDIRLWQWESVWKTIIYYSVHPAAHDLAFAIRSLRFCVEGVGIGEASVFTLEVEQHIACGTLTVLGNDDLCASTEILPVAVLVDVVVLRTVYEEYHIGILLDGTRLAKVAELWALAVESIALLYGTVEL